MVARFVENTQQLQRPSDARLEAFDQSAGAEAIARGAQDLAQGVQRVGDVLEQIGIARDEAMVRKLDAEDAVEVARIRASALSATGFDAEPAAQSALQALEERRKTRMSELKNQRQRALYSNIWSQRQATFAGAITEHTIKQTMAANREAAGARIDAYTDVAIDSYNDPEAFQQAIDTAVSDVKVRYQGAGADVIARQEKIVRSNIHKGIISNLVANPDTVIDAEEWRQKHSADILPEDETALLRSIQPVLEDEEDNADLGVILSGNVDAAVNEDGEPEERDPLAALPEGEEVPKPTRKPKPQRATVISQDPLQAVLRGKGRLTETAAGHRRRGSGNALDIAAPEGTAIYPPMSGEVIRTWHDAKGGNSVLIRHPNGYVTGYAHMRSPSPLKPGDKVDADTIIGAVGSTGKSTGPHLHYTVRTSSGGPKVDPQRVRWESVDITDQGNADHRRVDWKEGELPRYAAEKPQIEKALGDLHTLATRENWSARKYERMVSKVRQHYAVNESLYRQAQDEVYEAAAAAISAADLDGTPLTSRSQVPGYGRLDTAGRARIDGMLAANKKAAEGGAEGGVKANGDTFLDLLEGSATDPDTFQQIDLRVIPDITRGERARLIGIQSKMRGKDNEPSNFATSHGRIFNKIDFYANLGRTGFTSQKPKEEDRRRRAILFETVNARVAERQAQLKRPLTDDEIDAEVKRQIVAVTRRGGSGARELPRYVAERTQRRENERDSISIPRADRDRIVATWQRTHGGAMPTEREIAAIYLRSIGR